MTEPIALSNRFNAADRFILPNLEAGRGDKPYLICGEERLTYGELDARAHRMANALRELGIAPEQRVVLILPDTLDFPPCFWGILRAGAVAVPLNTLWGAGQYRQCLEDSRARALIVDAALWPQVEPAVAGLRHLRHVVVASGNVAGLPTCETLMESASAEPATEAMSPDEPAFWLYTSGSTGAPKAAVHLHHDMLYPARHFAQELLGLDAGDVTFSASKLFFAYGLGNSLYFPLATGGTGVLMPERPTPEGLFAVLARHRPTVFYAVPTLYNALLELHERWEAGEQEPPAELPRLEHLRFAVSAGEPLPEEIYRRWRDRFGTEILDGIGTTEMLQTFISNAPGASRPGSTGRVVPGYDARLVDEAGRDVPEGEVGSLWAKGESASPFYWNRREKTRQTMIGEWLVTGDRFRRDGEGFYYYQGRSDDMLKVGGVFVSPVEVEAALLGHAAVSECAVVGHADGQGLVRAKAFVVPREGHAPSGGLAESLIAHASAQLPRFKTPRWIEFREELPKTATGKIQRFMLRQ